MRGSNKFLDCIQNFNTCRLLIFVIVFIAGGALISTHYRYDMTIPTLPTITSFSEDIDVDNIKEGRVTYYSTPRSPAYCPTLSDRVVVIGAIGGSGTRAVQALLDKVSWFGADEVDEHGDTETCIPKKIRPFMSEILEKTNSAHYHWNFLRSITPEAKESFEKELAAAATHCYNEAYGTGACFWGFKDPKALFIWPVYRQMYPGAVFIHIVRDGRDMAFSGNLIQLNSFGDQIIPSSIRKKLTIEEQQMYFWNVVNMQAATLGKLYPEKYLMIRTEDLISKDDTVRLATIKKIIEFTFGRLRTVPTYLMMELRQFLDTPIGTDASMKEVYGKWRAQPRSKILRLEEIGKEALEHFGYL